MAAVLLGALGEVPAVATGQPLAGARAGGHGVVQVPGGVSDHAGAWRGRRAWGGLSPSPPLLCPTPKGHVLGVQRRGRGGRCSRGRLFLPGVIATVPVKTQRCPRAGLSRRAGHCTRPWAAGAAATLAVWLQRHTSSRDLSEATVSSAGRHLVPDPAWLRPGPRPLAVLH